MRIFTGILLGLMATDSHESKKSVTISNSSRTQTVTSPLTRCVNCEAIFLFNISKAQLHL